MLSHTLCKQARMCAVLEHGLAFDKLAEFRLSLWHLLAAQWWT